MQTPQLLQNDGLAVATLPLTAKRFLARSVMAHEEAAMACAMDSSIGLG